MGQSVRYLKTYNDLEKWQVLKGADVRDVLPVIEILDNMFYNHEYTLDHILEYKQIEQEHLEQIEALDSDDRAVLEEMANKILYQTYRKINQYYTKWLFVLERAEDMGVSDTMQWVDSKVTSFLGTLDRIYEENDKFLMEDYIRDYGTFQNEWDDKKLELEHLSPTWIEFFNQAFDEQLDRLFKHINYYENNVFGQWLASIRYEREWSLSKAQEVLNVPSSYIRSLENRTYSKLQPYLLRCMARGYNIPYYVMIQMAYGELDTIKQLVENGSYLVQGEMVTPKQRYEIVEIFDEFTHNEMVYAHQALDRLSEFVSRTE